MAKATFLDRDGVINRKAGPSGYITRWEEMQILPGVVQAVSLLNGAGYQVIIVTNQRCVAKGLISVSDLDKLHHKLLRRLQSSGAKIDALYFCPHDNEPPCSCRKPAPGMLLQAAKEHGLVLSQSWMIGDSDSDIEAGKRAGCKTARVSPATDSSSRPDLQAPSLLELVQKILIRRD
jgi:D-glycero-D-manno-heptose 1,7-bisphosphate phosphatase